MGKIFLVFSQSLARIFLNVLLIVTDAMLGGGRNAFLSVCYQCKPLLFLYVADTVVGTICCCGNCCELGESI